MNRRLVVISLGIFLLLVDLTLVALVVHPTSETEHRPAERAFSVGETGEYEVVAAITVDGEPVVTVEGVVTDSGDRYRRVRQEGVTSEVYRNGSGDGIEYGRTVVERENAERRLQQLREDPERSVRSERWENGTLNVVTRTEDPTSRVDPSGAASVVTSQLRLAAYGRSDSGSSGQQRVLRPRSGWYNGSRSYRLTDVSGEVSIEPATNVVYSARVEWDLTRGTRTYLHYLLHRSDTVTQTISYEYRTENVSIDPPDWVPDAPTERGANRTGVDPRSRAR